MTTEREGLNAELTNGQDINANAGAKFSNEVADASIGASAGSAVQALTGKELGQLASEMGKVQRDALIAYDATMKAGPNSFRFQSVDNTGLSDIIGVSPTMDGMNTDEKGRRIVKVMDEINDKAPSIAAMLQREIDSPLMSDANKTKLTAIQTSFGTHLSALRDLTDAKLHKELDVKAFQTETAQLFDAMEKGRKLQKAIKKEL